MADAGRCVMCMPQALAKAMPDGLAHLRADAVRAYEDIANNLLTSLGDGCYLLLAVDIHLQTRSVWAMHPALDGSCCRQDERWVHLLVVDDLDAVADDILACQLHGSVSQDLLQDCAADDASDREPPAHGWVVGVKLDIPARGKGSGGLDAGDRRVKRRACNRTTGQRRHRTSR